MELHGNLIENLRAAIQSSKRLQGRPVYPETLQFWSQLLEMARRRPDEPFDFNGGEVTALAYQLEHEIRRHRER